MSSPTTADAADAGGAHEPFPTGRVRSTGRPVLIGVAGGSGSGKSTVVRELVRALGADRVSVIQHDAYYRDLSHLSFEERSARNFDHPDSLETPLLTQHLRALLGGRAVDVPTYDFATHTRKSDHRRVAPTALVLLDGILVLADPELRALMDLSVFVHTDVEARLSRRLTRDVTARGRSRESVVEQFYGTVLPMHERFVEPSRKHADVTIVDGGHNRAAIDALVRRLEALAG